MKLTVFLFLITGLSAFAGKTYSQTKKLNLDMQNSTVKEVLLSIEEQSEFYFMYSEKLVDVKREVSVEVKNQRINDVLEGLFAGTDVQYKIRDRFILLTTSEVLGNNLLAMEQGQTVSGTVTDTEGNPLPGVNIVEKSTTNGAVTDLDGKYSITVSSEDAVLSFSFVGYLTEEFEVGAKTSIDVTLIEDIQTLDEVVVVGYGTQKRVNVTGAVDVIDNEQIQNRQAPTVSQLLQGLSPALNFAMDEGGFQPGASAEIDIRGIGSLNGGEPYVLIDGFPGNMNDLNPEDIESVSVLKDAAASAIYGARAPYGVILITTKSGKRGERFTANYTGNVMINTPQPLPDMLDSYTWARVQNEAGTNRGRPPVSNETIDLIIAYQNEDWDYIRNNIPDWPEDATQFGAYPVGNVWNNANLNYANNDWYDIFYGNSVNQKHNFSFQGGTENTSYYFSAGYLEQNGVLNYGTDKFQRYNVLGKVQTSITDWWDFNYEPRFSRSFRVRPNMNKQGDYGRMFHEIIRMYPFTPVYDGYGYYLGESKIPFLEAGTDNIKGTDHWQSFKTEIRPLKGWKVNADFAYNSFTQYRSDVEKHAIIHNVDKTPVPHGQSTPNNIEQFHTDMDYWTTNVYTSYDLQLNEAHNFFLMAGMQLEKGNRSFLTGYKTNLLVEDVPSLQTAVGDQIITESLSQRATTGYFSRFTYNYKSKYLLEANARYDGSYVFRETKRWGFFPSFSVGWNVHEEAFWESVGNIVNTFKIRGSWGQLGNQNVSPFGDIELIPLQTDKLNWIFGPGETRHVGYATAPNLVNRNLTWETATTKNIGLNLSFLSNRLQTDFDLFERITTDMIGPSEAKPGVLGASVPRENNATLRTRGWELAIRWKQSFQNQLSYFINLNLYDNKSVVTKYNNPTNTLSTWYNGKEVGEIWGYTVNDLFRSQEEVDQHLANVDQSFLHNNWRPGDLKYEDINGDGKLDNGDNTVDNPGDLSIIGSNSLRYQYGISGGLDFKGIYFNMLWRGVGKRDLYFNDWAQIFWGFHRSWFRSSLTTDNLDYFRDQPGDKYTGLYEGDANFNTDAFYPRPYLNNGEMQKNLKNPTTRYLQNGSYIRLQNIQLGYSIPQSIVSKLHLSELRIFFSGENLLTFSKLPDRIDPLAVRGFVEFNQDDGVGKTYGADRVFSFGISIRY